MVFRQKIKQKWKWRWLFSTKAAVHSTGSIILDSRTRHAAVALNTLVGGLVERRKIPDDIIVNAVLNLLNY